MGLNLRLNLFHDVEAPAVFDAVRSYYKSHGGKLGAPQNPNDAYELHARQGPWTALTWDGGWEWKWRREAQLHVSESLGTSGLLVFAYDGDYWGYELFDRGKVLDRFVQPTFWADDQVLFPGPPCPGNALAIASRFPELSAADLQPYLRPLPDGEKTMELWRASNTPVRPGDEFTRFHECAVIDFLRALGVEVAFSDRSVKFRAETWKRFSASLQDKDDTHGDEEPAN